jgi:hypothetical protein
LVKSDLNLSIYKYNNENLESALNYRSAQFYLIFSQQISFLYSSLLKYQLKDDNPTIEDFKFSSEFYLIPNLNVRNKSVN